jgi:hypothetical protein
MIHGDGAPSGHNMPSHVTGTASGIPQDTAKKEKKNYPRNRLWRPIGLRNVKDPTLSI